MPYKQPKIEKIYFSIGEVAGMFGVNTSLIRFWEREFDIIKPHKNQRGNRQFTQKDLDNFRIIFHLVKEEGLTLDGARRRLKNKMTDEEINLEIVKSLENIKEMLLEVKNTL
jgi:DNA-binding transcriptional MerR regulator